MPLPWEQDYGDAKAPAGGMPWEKDYGDSGQTFAERVGNAFDSSAYLPNKTFGLRPTREVPEPDRSTQSLGELLRNPSQRARNTALGTGPGSVAGISGAGVLVPAVGAGLAPLAAGLARGAAGAAKQLPGTALAATAGYVASHFDDQPEWVKEFVHNLLLHFQLNAGGKK
jgi:hypothetical protein